MMMRLQENLTVGVIPRSEATRDMQLLFVAARKQHIPHPDKEPSGFGMTQVCDDGIPDKSQCHPEERPAPRKRGSDEGYAVALRRRAETAYPSPRQKAVGVRDDTSL
jgi:hypothetical protein